jgi:hypothetical protein
LLEREIPIPYLERVLGELKTPQPSGQPSFQSPSAQMRTTSREEPEGWLRRLLASIPLLGMFFRRRPAATPSRRAPARETAAVDRDQPQLPEEVMRTMGLHYLMEEDRLNLIKPGKELPRITHGKKLPPLFSRFITRDLAEVHFATRAYPKIARTPEELRRKLSEKLK